MTEGQAGIVADKIGVDPAGRAFWSFSLGKRALQVGLPLLLAVAIVAGLSLFMRAVGRYEDAQAKINGARMVTGSLESAKRELSRLAFDYSFWNEGVDAMRGGMDEAWLQDNFGTYLLRTFNIATSTLVDGSGGVRFFASAKPGMSASLEKFDPSIDILLRQVRSNPDGSPRPAVGIALIDGQPHIVAASRFVSNSPEPNAGSQRAYLILSRELGVHFREMLQNDFGIDRVELRRDSSGDVALYDYAGNTLGSFALEQQSAASHTVDLIAPWSIAGVCLVALVMLFMLRRIVAVSDRYQHLSENLEQQVAERTRELNEQRLLAEHANRAKTEFLSRMSHELRTPMNSILGFAQVLQLDRTRLSEDQMESVDLILQAGEHLLGLINDVLDLARIDVGQMDLVIETVRLGPLIDQSRSLVLSLAQKYGVNLIPGNDPALSVTADARRLKQVLVNLLSNAIKYNREGGSVAIDVQPGALGHVRILVRDTGVGIREEDQSRLFDAFTRFADMRRVVEGVGIGLSISRRLAELMGGRMGFSSRYGHGSEFWIELPLAQ